LLANAETKERRARRLDHFFREAYALTFGLKPGEKRKVTFTIKFGFHSVLQKELMHMYFQLEDVTSDVIMVMRTTLSKKEFASALGMSDKDVFVLKMFNIVDRVSSFSNFKVNEYLICVILFRMGMGGSRFKNS